MKNKKRIAALLVSGITTLSALSLSGTAAYAENNTPESDNDKVLFSYYDDDKGRGITDTCDLSKSQADLLKKMDPDSEQYITGTFHTLHARYGNQYHKVIDMGIWNDYSYGKPTVKQYDFNTGEYKEITYDQTVVIYEIVQEASTDEYTIYFYGVGYIQTRLDLLDDFANNNKKFGDDFLEHLTKIVVDSDNLVIGNTGINAEEIDIRRCANSILSTKLIGKADFTPYRLSSYKLPDTISEIGDDRVFGGFFEDRTFSIDEYIILPKRLRKIGNNAFRYNGLKAIILPDETGIIGIRAFGNSSLEKIYLSNVKLIDECAFEKSQLKEIKLPASIRVIADNAFAFVDTLEYVSIGHDYGKAMEDYNTEINYKPITVNTTEEDSEKLNGYIYQGKFIFEGKETIEKVDVKEGVTRINQGTFKRCTGLTSVTLPSTLKSIEDEAFSGCSSLKSITLPEGLETIGKSAFAGTSIEEIVIPENVDYISANAFQNCKNLKKVVFKGNVKRIGEHAFENTAIRSIYIPDSVKEIAESAFENCNDLTSLNLPKKLVKIGDKAFYETNISKKIIVVPENVEYIGDYAFYNFKDVEYAIIPPGVSFIGWHAFDHQAGTDAPHEIWVYPIEFKSADFYIGYGVDIIHGYTGSKVQELVRRSLSETKFEEIDKGKRYDVDQILAYISFKESGAETTTTTATTTTTTSATTTTTTASTTASTTKTTTETKPAPETTATQTTQQTTPETTTEVTTVATTEPEKTTTTAEVTTTTTAATESTAAPETTSVETTTTTAETTDEIVITTTVNEPELADILYGDANCDGSIDLSDAILIMQVISNPSKFGVDGTDPLHITEQGLINGDCYNPGDSITLMDALVVQEYMIGLIDSMPIFGN